MNVMNVMKAIRLMMCGVAVLGVLAGAAQGGVITANDLEYSLETDKEVYETGETLHASYSLTNVGQSSFLLGLPSFSFEPFRDGSPDGIINGVFATTGTGFGLLGPSETFNWIFDIRLEEGGYSSSPSFEPGEYTLILTFQPQDGEILEAVSTSFTIVPEPASMVLLLGGGGVLLRRRKKRSD